MRRLLIYSLFVLIVAVGLVTLVEKDPGYVLISYGYTTVETSLWIALFILMVIFFCLYFLLRLLSRLSSPRVAGIVKLKQS